MLKIVFENQAFIAADKPHGWLSVPSRQGSRDPRPCLSIELGREGARIWPVHRLDQEVSGLVLFAKSAEAHREANSWFEGRRIHKLYCALSEGERPQERELRWESRLLRGKRRAYESPEGKPAVTLAWPQGCREFRGQSVLEWKLEPLTGRAHQLRYELARHGFPIVGDELYGSRLPFEDGAIALRSMRLDFSQCPSRSDYGLPEALEVKGL